jgi:hypothetical protein
MKVTAFRAGRMVGCSAQTIFKMIHQGILPAGRDERNFYSIDVKDLVETVNRVGLRRRGRPFKDKTKGVRKPAVIKIPDEDRPVEAAADSKRDTVESLMNSLSIEEAKKVYEMLNEAISARIKEHRRKKWETEQWKPFVADEHDVPPCEVDVEVDVFLQNGKQGTRKAANFCWDNRPSTTRIVAWRVTPEA